MARTIKSINIEIGKRIKQRRTELGYTREAMSRATGYSAAFIQEVERGISGLSSESLSIFAKYLNISADSLLYGMPSVTYDHLMLKLGTVPEAKLEHLFRLIDEAIECCK